MPNFGAPIDLAKCELQNARVQNLASAPSSPVEGQIYYDTVLKQFLYWNGTAWIGLAASVLPTLWDANTIVKADVDNTPTALTIAEDRIVGRLTAGVITGLTAAEIRTLLGPLNGFTSPTASLSLNSQTITSLATPVNPTDAANKSYVDATAQGLDVKGSVRVATTANLNLAAPGAAIDGVTLAQGDRVLVKNQTAPNGEQNGIYVFDSAATPMARATDADVSAEVNSGLFTFVEEGTAHGDQGWVLTTNNPITLDTTDLTFTQFSGAGTVVGTTDRITVTGTQVDIAATYTGQASINTTGTLTSGALGTGFTDVAVAEGGTGASTAAGAKTNLGFMTRWAGLIGDNSSTTLTITHNLGTEDVIVELYEASTKQTVYADIIRTGVNTCTAGFTNAPGTNAIRAVVIG